MVANLADADSLQPGVTRYECTLCGGQACRPVAEYPELSWVECACGLIYKRWQRSDISDPEFYGENYFTGGVYDVRTRRRIAKSRHQILDALNHTAPGPLLDIGCSLGYTLRAARELGLAPAGADVSDFAVRFCNEQGFEARQGGMDLLPFEDGRFAIVTMKHVLEHTPEPRRALREVRRVLRPGGVLFVAIPDARYRKAVRDPSGSRYYLPAVHGVEHFIYYTPATLSLLLQQEGFDAVRVNPALIHRRAPLQIRALQALVAPLRGAAQRALDALALRKEFWLTAVRSDSVAPRS